MPSIDTTRSIVGTPDSDATGFSLQSRHLHALHAAGVCASRTRRATAMFGAVLGLTALVLGGCDTIPGVGKDDVDDVAMEPDAPVEVAPMDVVLVSDFLRFYMDGDMEMDRGVTDCYGGLCVSSDGERILFNFPDQFVFAGFHDEDLTAHEGTIEDRSGIMIGDISATNKELPDILGVAVDRSTTGWGGWGEYVGFDALYYDYIRDDRPQRIVWTTLGGYGSEGNPVGEILTWVGGAVAIDYSVVTENRNLLGNSQVNLRFYESLGEFLAYVRITDLTDVVSGRSYEDMFFSNIPVRDGEFEMFELRARFFGPNHEEVGGVFDRDSITGGFAAKRVE